MPYFTGNLLDWTDRWKYGMKLASTFSSITPTEGGAAVAAPTTPPGVDAGYTSGAELRAVDTRRNIHFFDAIIDNDLSAEQMGQAANRLKLFTPLERKYLLDRTAEYVPRLRRAPLIKNRVLEGMAGWDYNLGLQLIFIHQLEGTWTDVDYKEVKPMIKALRDDAEHGQRRLLAQGLHRHLR